MIINDPCDAFERLIGIPSQHSLTISSKKRLQRNGIVYDTHWLEEYNANKTLIARFRTWTHQSLKPPYRKQVGWERFSLSGKLLDREVRYSRRASGEYLH